MEGESDESAKERSETLASDDRICFWNQHWSGRGMG